MDQANHWKGKTALFLASQCITLFGSMIVQMSIIWYVTLKTSSGGWVAAFTICSYLPQFLISFFAGVWADRHSHKKLIILADSIITIATAIMFFVMPAISSDSVGFATSGEDFLIHSAIGWFDIYSQLAARDKSSASSIPV